VGHRRATEQPASRHVPAQHPARLDGLQQLEQIRLSWDGAAVPGTLGEILNRPAEPPMRIEGFLPSGGRLLVVAQRKTGKTTFDLNLAKALIDGRHFLGRFATRPIAGIVGILNYEVSAGMLAGWAQQVGIPADKLFQVNLRGRRNPLGHQDDRMNLVELLRRHHVEVLIVDPFGAAYTGKSQNDPGEVMAWLGDLDRFAVDAGARELVLSVHAGWVGERTRGASSLEDWADVIATLTRDPDDDRLRYLSAFGRDVEVAEDWLHVEPDTRTLTLAGTGSRKHDRGERAVEAAMPAVLDYVARASRLLRRADQKRRRRQRIGE
jgi:RecA-family ATPase